MAKKKVTPLMKQYNTLKAKYPDAVLLFRVGDFYETFGSDAVKSAKILGITLTKRSNGGSNEELAGFPHHSLETYLPKLVRAGERVAICEQLEDPKKTKTIVKRGVTELVTPGVSLNDNTLDLATNNFLASVVFGEGTDMGASFLDVSTGDFFTIEGSKSRIVNTLNSFSPSEVLFSKSQSTQYKETFGDSYYSYRLEDWVFQEDHARALISKQLNVIALKGIRLEGKRHCILSAGAILQYLKDTQHHKTEHIRSIQRLDEESYLWMDSFTVKNLEIFRSNAQGGLTLIDILDRCKSAMGSRLLRRWLAFPLIEERSIVKRHDAVAHFRSEQELVDEVHTLLHQMGDIERISTKVATLRVSPRELVMLGQSIGKAEEIAELIGKQVHKPLQWILTGRAKVEEVQQKLQSQLLPTAPAQLHKAPTFQNGIHAELDKYRNTSLHAKEMLQAICTRESEQTGIPSLKIGFNNVFGYYLEVRNTHKDKVPESWTRKQTLVSAERYITEELKLLEQDILSAQSEIERIESELYFELLQQLTQYLPGIQETAQWVAQVDCLVSLADVARVFQYHRPVFSEEKGLEIREGRHPVIERNMPPEKEYIPNSVTLNQDQQIIMITGPNMSGKSAILRQTALIVILAQIGSFVPAENAKIGLVDKIFTRVGASDNISMGESTFMVEMNETASILHNISSRSLVLLDEIGRGTSTYDGISIAWAIAKYIHQHNTQALTLFATHYHELNAMQEVFPRISNYHVSVKEHLQSIVFLRKLKKGGSAHSFGIQVAEMAGVPHGVIQEAKRVLLELESQRGTVKNTNEKDVLREMETGMQLSLFQLEDPSLLSIKQELESLDINTLTPVEALLKLNQIKKMIGIS